MPRLLHPLTAYARGMRPIGGPYRLDEQWMLRNVVTDLTRGDRHFAVVTRDPDCAVLEVFATPAEPSSPVHTADSIE